MTYIYIYDFETKSTDYIHDVINIHTYSFAVPIGERKF